MCAPNCASPSIHNYYSDSDQPGMLRIQPRFLWWTFWVKRDFIDIFAKLKIAKDEIFTFFASPWVHRGIPQQELSTPQKRLTALIKGKHVLIRPQKYINFTLCDQNLTKWWSHLYIFAETIKIQILDKNFKIKITSLWF